LDRELIRPLRWLWLSLTGIITAWLLWMTLRPNPSVAVGLAPLTAPAAARGISPRWLIGLAGNVVVFAPLGFTLYLALDGHPLKRRFLSSTGGGALLSLFIELAQMARPSRVSSLEDWLLNTMGAALGALAAHFVVALWNASR